MDKATTRSAAQEDASSPSPGRGATMLYGDFTPGLGMGSAAYRLDAEAVARWRRLFPDDETGELMPHGMIAVVSMRAYGEVIPLRPPGNIHAAQHFELLRLPRIGEELVTSVSCLSKEIRRGRRRVTVTTETRGSGGPAFRGRMTVLWAA
ncbi:hypothetical protein [Pseudoroseomonas ludipueritiae]|uniref:N-terminal of MaoC-like dehydratase domain-containing protein n=1 Tax=Pseudoroseomonas ludipueritiae TaxID=198093 RepID=A0ABR7R6K3_9PROT|nr:hypothetical protein [Pseudoroseomonas ludipueritiae]MBC9177270.1 hypothetical protein [Pseudoroseomonas ludipueritiae]MCG7364277.1 hypothetical protein [Roseomonas sp. ACRSG]